MDNINHPDHYIREDSDIECIDAIESMLGKDQFRSYCRGNCLKYLWRYENKGGVEDLKKCQWYLDKLISTMEDPKQLLDKIESKLQKHFYVSIVGKDGCIIEKDKTYLGQDGISWIILGFTDDKKYPIRGWNANKGERWLRPEWLSSLSSFNTEFTNNEILNIKADNSGWIQIPLDTKKIENYRYTSAYSSFVNDCGLDYDEGLC